MIPRCLDAPDERETLDDWNTGAFDQAGVDLTQIDSMLELSPGERLVMLYETALSLSRLMPDADAHALL